MAKSTNVNSNQEESLFLRAAVALRRIQKVKGLTQGRLCHHEWQKIAVYNQSEYAVTNCIPLQTNAATQMSLENATVTLLHAVADAAVELTLFASKYIWCCLSHGAM